MTNAELKNLFDDELFDGMGAILDNSRIKKISNTVRRKAPTIERLGSDTTIKNKSSNERIVIKGVEGYIVGRFTDTITGRERVEIAFTNGRTSKMYAASLKKAITKKRRF